MVIWVTGLSGAGKTTLCTALHELVKPRLRELVLLDGDHVRAAFGFDLGYAEPDRIRQVRRLQGMSKVLADQGIVVLVAVLYNHPDLLAWNRAHMPDYFEVHIDASIETVAARDPKGLYAGARAGTIPDVVGIDVPWHPPEHADLTLDANDPESPEIWAREIVSRVERLRAAVEGEASTV